MTSLIIYAVIFGGLALGLFGMIRSHDNGIRSAQKTADTVLLTACQTNEKTVTDANTSLQADVKTIAADRDTQNLAVAQWKQLADRAATVAQDNLNANQSTLALLGKAYTAAKTKAATTVPGQTCEQTLGEIDADSKDFATQFAPAKPAGVLRIGK